MVKSRAVCSVMAASQIKMGNESNDSFSSVVCLITLFFMLSTPISGDPLLTYCLNEGNNYTLNSPFENNLKSLLEILPSITWVTGYFNTSIGDGSDEVNGQALCRGDVNSTVCLYCIRKASQDILKKCRSREAIIWYELCQVRYSLQMDFPLIVDPRKYPEWDYKKGNISNPAHFNEILTFLMTTISYGAAFDRSKLMFATGEIKLSSTETIYGLVQCTRDIPNCTCYNCLQSALRDLRNCCQLRQGGTVLYSSCNLRFELNPFYNASGHLLAYPKGGHVWSGFTVVLATCILALFLAVLLGSYVFFTRQRRKSQKDMVKNENAILHDMASTTGVNITEGGNLVSSEELSFMDIATIRAATCNFSDSNKLGQGGFGSVYKGVLPDGKEIAVKRLSGKSQQGLEEFKNEIILIAKLQHRNLVRLLGCCIAGEEKLLIYELMPNKSLDMFVFDSERCSQLNWNLCYSIIHGIARGLLYLHEESRLKIIHRDLKPNNVLLDHEMVAKISDFGMARIFGENQSTANTKRVVGTFGYMAPEYAMEGRFSVKSDVFSFGVILLEIISRKRNNGVFLTKHAQTLLAYAWRLWNEGKGLEFADPLWMETGFVVQVLRCIHISLLCVQEDPVDRPTMSSVVVLLGSETIALPEPRQPAFSMVRVNTVVRPAPANPSVNDLTASTISAR